MIEYLNEKIKRCQKQYDMLLKSLKYIPNYEEKSAIYYQMTKLTEQMLEYTNEEYEKKYNMLLSKRTSLMEDEKAKMEAIINLINERKTYISNTIETNREKTNLDINNIEVLGEDNLEEYKNKLRIIDKYNSNVKNHGVLIEEIKDLEDKIVKAKNKIKNNEYINTQFEHKMKKILKEVFTRLNLYELKERSKEIDLAYTELGYSLEKAKENAKVARNSNSEAIIVECDKMLSAITLEYERYKEKKLTLKLMEIFENEVTNYDELLAKREIINNILSNITNSELYNNVGQELNKQYNTIKLESQDLTTLESLIDERNNKKNQLAHIIEENDSEEFKNVLKELLENEKKHELEILQERKRKAELERIKKLEEEQKLQMKRLEQQKMLEEERNKEIERRSKQLLEEQQKSVLTTKEEVSLKPKKTVPKVMPSTKEEVKKPSFMPKKEEPSIPPRRLNEENEIKRESSIPVIKNNNLKSEVVGSRKLDLPKTPKMTTSYEIRKEISKPKPKENLFPDIPVAEESFFDEDEIKDLNNFMESDNKTSWF